MTINFHSVVLITNQFEILKDFYKNILHQEIEFDFGNCIGFKGGFSIWQLQHQYPITKALGKQYDPSGNKNLEVCFDTDEFDEVIDSLKIYSIGYLHGVEEESWGQRTIRFYDPDKNLVEIGESMRCFALRLYYQGLDAKEIVKRTSIPLDMVIGYLKNDH